MGRAALEGLPRRTCARGAMTLDGARGGDDKEEILMECRAVVLHAITGRGLLPIGVPGSHGRRACAQCLALDTRPVCSRLPAPLKPPPFPSPAASPHVPSAPPPRPPSAIQLGPSIPHAGLRGAPQRVRAAAAASEGGNPAREVAGAADALQSARGAWLAVTDSMVAAVALTRAVVTESALEGRVGGGASGGGLQCRAGITVTAAAFAPTAAASGRGRRRLKRADNRQRRQ